MNQELSVVKITRANPDGEREKLEVTPSTTVAQIKAQLSPDFESILRKARTFEQGFRDSETVGELESLDLEIVVSDMAKH